MEVSWKNVFNKIQKWLATEHTAESRVQRLLCCFLKNWCNFVLIRKTGSSPLVEIFFFLHEWAMATKH